MKFWNVASRPRIKIQKHVITKYREKKSPMEAAKNNKNLKCLLSRYQLSNNLTRNK